MRFDMRAPNFGAPKAELYEAAVDIGDVLRNHTIGHRPQQVRAGVKVKGRRSVSDPGASVDPQMSQPACTVLRQQLDRGVAQLASPLLGVGSSLGHSPRSVARANVSLLDVG